MSSAGRTGRRHPSASTRFAGGFSGPRHPPGPSQLPSGSRAVSAQPPRVSTRWLTGRRRPPGPLPCRQVVRDSSSCRSRPAWCRCHKFKSRRLSSLSLRGEPIPRPAAPLRGNCGAGPAPDPDQSSAGLRASATSCADHCAPDPSGWGRPSLCLRMVISMHRLTTVSLPIASSCRPSIPGYRRRGPATPEMHRQQRAPPPVSRHRGPAGPTRISYTSIRLRKVPLAVCHLAVCQGVTVADTPRALALTVTRLQACCQGRRPRPTSVSAVSPRRPRPPLPHCRRLGGPAPWRPRRGRKVARPGCPTGPGPARFRSILPIRNLQNRSESGA